MVDLLERARARQKALNFLQKVSEHDPVPCGSCTACCRGNTAVALNEEWGDNPADFAPHELAAEQVRSVGPGFSVVLARKPNGDCIFLGEQGCTIYARRPAVCRAYDCRRQVAKLSRPERRELIRNGVFSKEIIAAGVARKDTIKWLPEEKAMWNGDHHAFLMGRVR